MFFIFLPQNKSTFVFMREKEILIFFLYGYRIIPVSIC
jgi:hypothetical protein